MGEEKDLLSSLLLELRRGTLTISVLSQMKEPKYGYALVQSLEEKGITEGTIGIVNVNAATTSTAQFPFFSPHLPVL